MSFTTRRELLNPQFEGYKLSLIAQGDAVKAISIAEYPATQSTSSTKTLLTFKEVQSRISHNHLATDGRRALYFDSSFNIVEISFRPDVSCRVVYTIPRPVQTESNAAKHREYPSAAFAGTSVFVSDGAGTVYVLEVSDDGPYILVSSTDALDTPFKIHSAQKLDSGASSLVVSSRNYHPTEVVSTSKPLHVDYHVRGLHFEGHPPTLSVAWERIGEDVPLCTFFQPKSQSIVLLGESIYRSLDSAPAPSYTPSPAEIAPIPQTGENLDAATTEPAPPPYSWYQTDEELTVAFALPSTTLRSQISVSMAPKTVSLHIAAKLTDTFVFPDLTDEVLFANIDPSESTWTWDKADGMLMLHLEKRHPGDKWMHVFEGAGTGARPDVPETIDPSELVKVREALEKHTSGADLSGLGLGTGAPALASGEMDDEVDLVVGKEARLTVVGREAEVAGQYPLRLLSTPLPGYPQAESIIAKENLDGVVFTGGPDGQWEHTSTFGALAFVLASKQDTRFVHHTPTTVLAFESGSSARGGGNVYIYRAATVGATSAKQSVLKIGDGGGSLLGVSSVQLVDGSHVILCLKETVIVVLHGVL